MNPTNNSFFLARRRTTFLGALITSVPLLGACTDQGGASTGGDGDSSEATGGNRTGGASGDGDGAPGSGGGSTGGTAGDSGGNSATGGAEAVGGFFGASRCSDELLLCDGFEGASIDDVLWDVVKDEQNTVEVTTGQAARGTQSVRLQLNNGKAFLRNSSIFPVANNDYFGRMFLRVARFSTVDWAHWTVAEGAGTGSGSLIRVGGQYNTSVQKNRWGVGSDGGPTGDWTNHDQDPGGNPVEPPTDTWVCLEWEHKGSTNETRFFVDGVEHPSLATSATDHGGSQAQDYILPQMTSFWFGWWQYQADPVAFEVWIDEVALDDARIGCEN